MPEILWGPMLGLVHIATLVAAIIINLVLYAWLSRTSRKTQVIMLFFLSLSGIAAIVYNLVAFGSPWENLPLQLYSLNAILLPLAVLTRKKGICNLLFLWSAGSYVALIFHAAEGMADVNLFSWSFVFYYFPHVLGAGIPMLLLSLKLVEKSYKAIKPSLIITLACYTIIHFINVAINSGIIGPGNIDVNYMSSMAPSNSVLQLFWMIIPSEYWYMILIVPFILLYVGWWFLPEILEHTKHTKIRRAKIRAINEYYDEYEEEYIDEIIDD